MTDLFMISRWCWHKSSRYSKCSVKWWRGIFYTRCFRFYTKCFRWCFIRRHT